MRGDPPFAARHSWRRLQAGPRALDGGAMFGIAPRPVWSRTVTPDARHRIHLAHNCLAHNGLLLDAPGGQILVEAGSSGRFDAKLRDISGLGKRTVLDHEPSTTPSVRVRPDGRGWFTLVPEG